MSKLYATKFKMALSIGNNGKPDKFIPEGTVFTVSHVEFCMVVLSPINKGVCDEYRVDLNMLNYAFTEN